MEVIPAIDIRGGKVVRLVRGDFRCQTVYSDSPVEVAKELDSFGIELMHIVDLDGALVGELKNLDIVKEIIKNIKARVELGGGIRDEATIKKVFDIGVDKVVIGTKALDEEFVKTVASDFKGRIVAGIDAKEGVVHTKGWVFRTKTKAVDLAARIRSLGIERINYTDISKDGTLEGPNIESFKELLKAVDAAVIASGGITTIADVKRLKDLEKDGLAGIIIGKALYEKTIDLRLAIRIGRGGSEWDGPIC